MRYDPESSPPYIDLIRIGRLNCRKIMKISRTDIGNRLEHRFWQQDNFTCPDGDRCPVALNPGEAFDHIDEFTGARKPERISCVSRMMVTYPRL